MSLSQAPGPGIDYELVTHRTDRCWTLGARLTRWAVVSLASQRPTRGTMFSWLFTDLVLNPIHEIRDIRIFEARPETPTIFFQIWESLLRNLNRVSTEIIEVLRDQNEALVLVKVCSTFEIVSKSAIALSP